MVIYNAFMGIHSPLGTQDHVQDVLGAAIGFLESGESVAIAIVTRTEGGSVRSCGALMAVSESGEVAGYLSGGCIDADVRLNALNALKTDQTQQLRYGTGSPFADIRLPCGGAIEVLIVPGAKLEILHQAHDRLNRRHTVSFAVQTDGTMTFCDDHSLPALFRVDYRPKLMLRIAGRGADCLAISRLALASGFEIQLQLPDEADIQAARAAGIVEVERLTTPASLPRVNDDASTAFVLMFHDSHWETALLWQALQGPAFYVGAVGSSRTHTARCELLRQAGTSQHDIERVRGPIGLVPSMRDASMLAISTLAEIIDVFHRVEADHV